MAVVIGCSGWSYADSFDKGGWVKYFIQMLKLKNYNTILNFLTLQKWTRHSMKNSTSI